MTKTKYRVTDDDLTSIFREAEQRGISVIATAKARIHAQAKTMGISISPDELERFSLLLIALEQE
jgi:hypothetical protein